jgi:excisionase family DNA binding protein
MSDKNKEKIDVQQFLSVSRTAEYLDCSIQFVYQMIGTGELKAIKLGTQTIRVSVSSINEYIESRWIDPETYRMDMEKHSEQPEQKKIQKMPARSNWMRK